MMTYLKRNPLGNATVIGWLVISLGYWFILSLVPEGADGSEAVGLVFSLPVFGILSGLISFFVFRRGSISSNNNSSGYYESNTEKIIFFICTLITASVVFMSGYYQSDNTGLVMLSIIVLPVAILTRQWPFYKRIIWVVAIVFFLVFMLSLKPDNF